MFTQDLTRNLTTSLKTLYPESPSGAMTCVEIGAFEGKGSILISKYLCKHDASILYCIDPLDNEYVKGNESLAFWNGACNGQRERFYHNTKDVTNLVLFQGYSDTMIPRIKDNSVDFVYIDGDHSPEQVYKDAVNMWGKMKKGSIILFDDYKFVVNGVITAKGIDKFLDEKKGAYELLLKEYQLAIRVL